MFNFIKKMTDWVLEKEEEAAKKCMLKETDIEEQIKKTKEKKEALEKECKENLEAMNSLLERLEKIKEYSKSCDIKNEK